MDQQSVNPFRGYRPDQIGVGNEGNTSQVNEPGVYWDPVSDKTEEVFFRAAADALVRMGWVQCEVERDEDGRVTKVIKPNYGGRRPEDSDEVLELRRKLAEANAALKASKQTEPKANTVKKTPAKKVGGKLKEGNKE